MSATVIRRVGGYLKDSHDYRDVFFRAIRSPMQDLAGVAVDEHSIQENTPISDQLSLGSCVANAWVDALEILMGVQDPNSVVQLSRLFLYWTTRGITGDQKKDSGTQLRSGAKQLTSIGICEEKRWPYDISKVFVSPGLECFNVASDNELAAYYSINDIGMTMLDDIEVAVKANHPVVFGIQVGDTFDGYVPGTVMQPPSTTRGGHAIIVVGFRKYADGRRDFKIRNSWSDQWGESGHAWFSQEYMMQARDLWVGTKMPTLVV
jgi:C1A family cysteine protease